MKTFAMALDLKDDKKKIEKYIDYHKKVWVEVTEGLLSIGITEMKIFLTGNRLFMFLRTEDNFDLGRDFQRYTSTSIRAKEWDELMRNYQQKVPSAGEEEWWSPMTEVFSLRED